MLIRILHSFLLYLLTFISFIVGTALAAAGSIFSKDKVKTYQDGAQLWARFLMFFSGIKVTVQNLENIPTRQPAILVANHQGVADIPILLAFLPGPFRFAIKKELFRIPLFGWYLRQAGYFSIDREQVLSAYKTLEKMVEILKAGDSVLIFPEGTRSRDGTLGKFKRGSLMAALKAGVPIVPVAISGSYQVLPRGTRIFQPAKVKLSIGKPLFIKSEEEYGQKVEEVRAAIAELL